jgi:hypothetical protein
VRDRPHRTARRRWCADHAVRGRLPRSARTSVRLPCWPMRGLATKTVPGLFFGPAHSCHQSLIGLSRACSGMTEQTRPAMFFQAPAGLRDPARNDGGERRPAGSSAAPTACRPCACASSCQSAVRSRRADHSTANAPFYAPATLARRGPRSATPAQLTFESTGTAVGISRAIVPRAARSKFPFGWSCGGAGNGAITAGSCAAPGRVAGPRYSLRVLLIASIPT